MPVLRLLYYTETVCMPQQSCTLVTCLLVQYGEDYSNYFTRDDSIKVVLVLQASRKFSSGDMCDR